ncbi:MAG: hypothetical protein FJ125_05820, partial [Deltaproteobacteria bacterium]|nr:hypothetical protein [Deltaproteobacteria bacterium]
MASGDRLPCRPPAVPHASVGTHQDRGEVEQSMSNGRIFLALLPALLLLLPVPTGPALAARQPAERLLTSTSGLLLANPSAATACSVLATEQNPAALIAVQGAEATFLYVDSDGGPGGGAGFFFGLPLTSFWVPAVALQWLDRTVPVDRAASKTTLSSAFGTPAVAFGVNYSFFGSGDAQVDKLHAWDIGLLGRPWRWLSMAAVARNANGADLGQTSLPVVWDLGLALRPLTWRVTFNGDVLLADRQGEQADVLQEARFGLRLHPLPSLQLEASLGVDGGGLTTAGFAIGFSEEVVSLQGQTIRDARSGSDFESLASGALAQLHAAHRPPLVQFRRAQTVELTLSGSYPEPKPSGLFAPSGRTFSSLLADLRRLRTDRRIGTLLLRISDLEIGLAQAEELRQALTDLRQRGILVHAHLEDSTTTTYYLASAADIITMTPGSELLLLGLSTTFTYLGDALARLRVQPEFVRIG